MFLIAFLNPFSNWFALYFCQNFSIHFLVKLENLYILCGNKFNTSLLDTQANVFPEVHSQSLHM